jgi:flagellar basal-body rod protein FlgB
MLSGFAMSSISNPFPSVTMMRTDDAPFGQSRTGGVDEEGSSFRELMAQSLRKTSLNGLRTDAHHMPLPDRHVVDEQFEARALGILSERQQLIASNIANADTPNYKARDFDLREAMREANLYRAPPLSLAATSASHQAGALQRTAQALALMYPLPSQGSVDGNTVEMDTERAKFAENGLRFQFSLNQVKDDGKDMTQLLAGLKG